MLETPSFDVVATLYPVRRALGLRLMWQWSLRGLAAGGILAALVLLLNHLRTVPLALPVAVAVMIAGPAVAAALCVVRWPRSLDAARAVDRHFRLQDRLTTALELRADDGPLTVMQRAQAQQVVQGLSLTNSARRAVGRFDLAAVTLATIAFASFLLLPTSAPRPAAASPSSRAAMNAVRATALAHLATISRSFEAGLTPEQRHSAAARQARAVLAHLESALHHAQTADEALRAISQAQQDLQRLRAGLHPITHQAAAGLNQALSNYMTPQERRVSSQRAEQVASSLLDRLARTATRGSEQERAAEARALASAANKIPDSQLRADLRAAASAIGHHNMQLARQALQHAAQRAARSPADKQTQSRLKRTSSKLDSLKNAVSQIHGSTARALSEKGKLAAVTNGQTNRSRGGANRGSAQSVGATGSGPGDSALNEKGQQHGVGGPATEKLGKPSSSSNAGNYNTVYVPGIAGAGSHLLPVDLRGAPRRGQVVPYQQVIGHYRQTARTALERSQLPPSLRNYVRRYFTALAR